MQIAGPPRTGLCYRSGGSQTGAGARPLGAPAPGRAPDTCVNRKSLLPVGGWSGSWISGTAGACRHWARPRLSGRYGVNAMETGARPTLMAVPASPVVVQIGVTVSEPLLTT